MGSGRDRAKRAIKRALIPQVRGRVRRREEIPESYWGVDRGVDGRLKYEGVDLAALTEAHGSPLHVLLERRLEERAAAFTRAANGEPRVFVAYSYKTNPVPGVLAKLHELDVGAEVISPYELWLAFRLGVPPDRIVYGGPAKSRASIRDAIAAGIKLLNINHPEEIDVIEEEARALHRRPTVGIRITAGGWAGQFGARIETGEADAAFRRALRSEHLDVAGVHAHRGMLIRDADDVAAHLGPTLEYAAHLVEDLGVDLRLLDLGGSLAVPSIEGWTPLDKRLAMTFLAPAPSPAPSATIDAAAYVDEVGARVRDVFGGRGLPLPEVVLEPGRAMTAEAQLLLSTVVATRRAQEPPPYAVLDAGINAAESAQHEYHRVSAATRAGTSETWRLAGPTCTPHDILLHAWEGPAVQTGDVLAIFDAGAYFVPFSTTFSFPRPGVVSIREGTVTSLRRAETFEDLVRRDGA